VIEVESTSAGTRFTTLIPLDAQRRVNQQN
jgi:hypothetical protein